jgi:hypothetical protein
MVKAVIDHYSKKLGLDQVELFSDEYMVAKTSGEKITCVTNTPHAVTGRHTVIISDMDGIAHTFFHVDLVEDLRIGVQK